MQKRKKYDFEWKVRSKFTIVLTLTSDPVTSNQRKSSILQLFLRPTNIRKAVKDYVPIIKGAAVELQVWTCTTTLYDTKFATHLQHDLLITDQWRHFLPKFPERDANENIIICEILGRNQPNFSCMFILAYLFNALLIAWPGKYEIWWCIRCLEQDW